MARSTGKTQPPWHRRLRRRAGMTKRCSGYWQGRRNSVCTNSMRRTLPRLRGHWRRRIFCTARCLRLRRGRRLCALGGGDEPVGGDERASARVLIGCRMSVRRSERREREREPRERTAHVSSSAHTLVAADVRWSPSVPSRLLAGSAVSVIHISVCAWVRAKLFAPYCHSYITLGHTLV